LYRSGRQADALRAYQAFRSCLIDELGLEPSASLQRLDDDTLLNKPDLDWTERRDDAQGLALVSMGTSSQPSSVGSSPRGPFPARTVTCCFTDIEGSTGLIRRLGHRYAELLERHRQLLRAAVANRGGVEVYAQGDGLLFGFGSAASAVAATVAGQ